MNREKIELPMATLEFVKYEEDGLTFYEFNATQCQPPEPMVNAIHGIKLLKNENDRLVGIFFHEPTPLYERVGSNYTYEAIELENGDFKIIFRLN
ncbi:MAG: hypothetical protein U9P38_02595 [Campylobacterota bacterium]|nr:hypothetical protein [Campylobacterota bacterium]